MSLTCESELADPSSKFRDAILPTTTIDDNDPSLISLDTRASRAQRTEIVRRAIATPIAIPIDTDEPPALRTKSLSAPTLPSSHSIDIANSTSRKRLARYISLRPQSSLSGRDEKRLPFVRRISVSRYRVQCIRDGFPWTTSTTGGANKFPAGCRYYSQKNERQSDWSPRARRKNGPGRAGRPRAVRGDNTFAAKTRTADGARARVRTC